MLDWYSGLAGYDASGLPTDEMVVWNPVTGEVKRQMDWWLDVTGSFDTNIRVRKVSSAWQIYQNYKLEMLRAAKAFNLHMPPEVIYLVSFNPAKLLQGQNVFGPSVVYLDCILKESIKQFPDIIRPPDIDDELPMTSQRTRVDIATSIRMDSHAQVHEWLNHAKNETRTRRKKDVLSFGERTGMTGPGTVYWQAKKRWMIRAYCKYCELEVHPPVGIDKKVDAVKYDRLREYSEGLLRIELELHRPELKDRGTLDENESGTEEGLIIWQYFSKIEVGVMKKDADQGKQKLRPPVKAIYELWLAGHDVTPAAGYCKRATFYKFRKEIQELTGQDISLLTPEKETPAGAREQLEIDYLKEHEEKEIPADLKRDYMFEINKPKKYYPAHPPGYKLERKARVKK